MSEEEEFEFRARLEAEEAEGQGAPTPAAQPESPLWKRAVGAVARQFERVPGAIRGAVQAYQTGDAPGAADMALQGFKDPASVQTTPEMMARAGASTDPKIQIRTPPPDAEMQARAMGNIPGVAPKTTADTSYTTQAEELGRGFDAIAPTGLEFLPRPLAAALGRMGGGVRRAGTDAIQSSLKPSQALRRGPVPYNSENFLTPRPGAPEGGLASAMGKTRTLENITGFHERLGDAQDAILGNMPRVDLMQSISEAARDVEDALRQGGNGHLGVSVQDAPQLRREIDRWVHSASEISPSGLSDGRQARNFRTSLAAEARYDRPEANSASRAVAATIRERLNEQIGQLSPEFRAIDRQFAETIPLRNAVAESMGREANKYPIGLRSAMMMANPATALGGIAKIAAIEGTSRFAPQVAVAKAGRAMQAAAENIRRVSPFPYANMVRSAGSDSAETSLPPYLRRPR